MAKGAMSNAKLLKVFVLQELLSDNFAAANRSNLLTIETLESDSAVTAKTLIQLFSRVLFRQ